MFLLLTLAGCDRDDLYQTSTFSENVYNAYEDCRDTELRFLAGKHNIQTAFEPCGSNNFVHYRWAPDGVQLYFQLPMSAHILNGVDKTIGTVPTEVPVGDAAWMAREYLVFPIAPPKGGTKQRMLRFDRMQASVIELELDVEDPRDLMPTGSADSVYFTAESEGARRIFVANFTEMTVAPIFPFVTSADTFTYEPAMQQLAVGEGDTVRTFTADGGLLETFPDATRGSIHPAGRYVALEKLGEPISPFDQRSWNELSEDARERELRRMEEWLAKQPEWVMTEVSPPVIEVWDRDQSERWRFTSFYGSKFQWYPYQPELLYASFVLWGLEGKEMNRNVAITQLHERLRMAGNGETPMGMEKVVAQTGYADTPQPIGG
ncbi:MAG TPA: hypothetical protein QGF58_06800 [Myxococcota bacterium]|nr:hypothetical protein [Myxococcota bacterium]